MSDLSSKIIYLLEIIKDSSSLEGFDELEEIFQEPESVLAMVDIFINSNLETKHKIAVLFRNALLIQFENGFDISNFVEPFMNILVNSLEYDFNIQNNLSKAFDVFIKDGLINPFIDFILKLIDSDQINLSILLLMEIFSSGINLDNIFSSLLDLLVERLPNWSQENALSFSFMDTLIDKIVTFYEDFIPNIKPLLEFIITSFIPLFTEGNDIAPFLCNITYTALSLPDFSSVKLEFEESLLELVTNIPSHTYILNLLEMLARIFDQYENQEIYHQYIEILLNFYGNILDSEQTYIDNEYVIDYLNLSIFYISINTPHEEFLDLIHLARTDSCSYCGFQLNTIPS